MRIFLQVAVIGPTADWFTHKTSLSTTSMPPSETTKINIDISVAEDTDSVNSPDRSDVLTTKNSGDDLQKEVGRDGRIYDLGSPGEVTSENMWERTEVLAGKAVFPLGLTARLTFVKRHAFIPFHLRCNNCIRFCFFLLLLSTFRIIRFWKITFSIMGGTKIDFNLFLYPF